MRPARSSPDAPALFPAALAAALATLATVVVVTASCAQPGSAALPDTVFGHCVYENPFSHQTECEELHGSGWDAAGAEAACGQYHADVEPGPCGYAETMGTCVIRGDDPSRVTAVVVPAEDPAKCADNQRGCELFAGGTFVKGSVCGGASAPDPDDAYETYYLYALADVGVPITRCLFTAP